MLHKNYYEMEVLPDGTRIFRPLRRWESYLKKGLKWRCSNCGSRYEERLNKVCIPWHYCPACGKRMDEVREDDRG